MSDSWVVNNLDNALETWNEKFSEILSLITQSPQNFKGGSVWGVIVTIHGALEAIGLSLLVLFFVVGVIKTCGSFTELKRPELAVKLFIRFVIAKAAVTYGMELMLSFVSIIQGIVSTIASSAGFGAGTSYALPSEMVTAIEGLGFFESIPLWFVSLIGSLLIWVLAIIMILTVYGRFFRLYLYTAISPIPLATFAGEPTSSIGRHFIRSYAGVCLEGAIIVLACVIFSALATGSPNVDADASVITMVWSYIGELLFNMLILVGIVKAADKLIKEMMGL